MGGCNGGNGKAPGPCSPPKPPVGCRSPPPPDGATLEALVEQHLADKRDRVDLDFYRQAPSLQEAIRRATLCIDHRGKRHGHQRRIPLTSLQEAHEVLADAPVERCASFRDLHELVKGAIEPTWRVGPLVIYDVAHRIGCYLGLAPEEVYLHRGAREGARSLGLDVRGKKTLPVSALPPALQRLTPEQAEDFLCIYKAELKRLRGSW